MARIPNLTRSTPGIVAALINGKEPNGLSLAKRPKSFPEDVADQCRQFGFATD